jgi:hypothetical protein
MKVVEPGHIYSLANLDSPNEQLITFLRRSSPAIQHEFDHPGTNTQELLRVIIDLTKIALDRTEFLQEVIPAVENQDFTTYGQELLFNARRMLLCYEGRAYRRKLDKVNRGKDEHSSFRERDRDLPFDERGFIGQAELGIENLPVGDDGHIKLD